MRNIGKIQYRTKNELVYEMIKEKIINNELEMGTTITIRNIAEEIGVSETPVREAFKRLEVEGLINIVPHSGITVAVPSLKELKERMDIRLMLEPKAIELLVEVCTDEMVTELEQYLCLMSKCIDNKNAIKYSLLDKEFHNYMYQNCGNLSLYQLISDLWLKSERTRSIFVLSNQYMKESHEEHLAIINAIRDKDTETASELLRKHKEMSFRKLLKHIEEYYQKNGFEYYNQ